MAWADGPKPRVPAVLTGVASTQPCCWPSGLASSQETPEGSQPKSLGEVDRQWFSPWGVREGSCHCKSPTENPPPCRSRSGQASKYTGVAHFSHEDLCPKAVFCKGQCKGPESKQKLLVCLFRRNFVQMCSHQAVREAAAYRNLT